MESNDSRASSLGLQDKNDMVSSKNNRCAEKMASPRSAAPGPLTKKWFRKQFGIRKEKDDKKPEQDIVHSLRMTTRRSSSLPDLASMLEAAGNKINVKCRRLCSLDEKRMSELRKAKTKN